MISVVKAWGWRITELVFNDYVQRARMQVIEMTKRMGACWEKDELHERATNLKNHVWEMEEMERPSTNIGDHKLDTIVRGFWEMAGKSEERGISSNIMRD